MHILTINAGSSSVKFSVFDMATNTELFKSELERVSSVAGAIKQIPDLLKAQKITKLDAIGHRVAHGGAIFKDPVQIDETVIKAIIDCSALAPLHNPPALEGIKVAQEAWPDLPQIAVFDTAFHQTIPKHAYTYAVPEKWREAGLRRYGFHGTSHKYVMMRVAEELKTPPARMRIISCHLGNGASVCAIEHGVSIDTSMGMTALEGLVMGTRSGDVDPGIFAYLSRTMGLKVDEIEAALYSESGLMALSGLGNDMRDIEKQAALGHKKAQLAIQVYTYRVRKYIGAYAAAMGGVDVITFTGGIGENSSFIRKRICERLDYLGLDFDDDKNINVKLTDSEAPQIQQDSSIVKVLVTRTREQWMIAQETERALMHKPKKLERFPPIPIAVSAHHIHLTQDAVDQLFGKGYQLRIRNTLSQPRFWASEEVLDVIGPQGEIKNVRVLGPNRSANQIEIAETEGYILGLDPPVRLSGDVTNTPVVTLKGPKGEIKTQGLIVAKRHIHMNSKDAAERGLKHDDIVEVAVTSGNRDLVFKDVVIRTDPDFVTQMQIDTDEANAAHIVHEGMGELKPLHKAAAHITMHHTPWYGKPRSLRLKKR